ncbi:MAG: hypothetical protein Q8S73_08210 [Deltaproteobacteria bacterium]|nr:hypothetical protein [Myxococcales bacterium]MDP3214072.1 hypothetical protein [Deltaproteobacteria bacterium]
MAAKHLDAMVVRDSVPRRSVLQCAALALAGCRGTPGALPSRWGAAGLGRPRALAAAAGHVFVLDDSPEGFAGAVVFRVPLTGGLARAAVHEPRGIIGAAACPAGLVWAVRREGLLRAMSHDRGATPRTLATRQQGFASAMATDGREVFCSTLDGPLMAVPLGGGPGRALFPAAVYVLALGPGALVFFADGALRSVPHGDGVATVLAPARDVAAIVVRGPYVYWTEHAQPRGTLTGALRRVALAGGAVETLVERIHDPDTLAVGDERAWYAGTHFVPEARVRVHAVGSVGLADRRHRYSESSVTVTDLLCEGASLYLTGTAGGKVGGVVRRQPA